MDAKESELILISEAELFDNVSAIIENRKGRAIATVNSETTLWEVGHYVSSALLGNERATYGKQIVSMLSKQLEERYGNSFSLPNMRRMMRFAQRMTDKQIVTTLSSQLTWSHIVELLPLERTNTTVLFRRCC